MTCTTMQITNIIVSLVTTHYFYNDTTTYKENMYYRRIPIDIILFLIRCKIIWDGTSFDKLFRNTNIFIMLAFALIDLSFYFYILVESRDLFTSNEEILGKHK